MFDQSAGRSGMVHVPAAPAVMSIDGIGLPLPSFGKASADAGVDVTSLSMCQSEKEILRTFVPDLSGTRGSGWPHVIVLPVDAPTTIADALSASVLSLSTRSVR